MANGIACTITAGYTIIVAQRSFMTKKPTIQELEDILNSEETTPVKILPNGEIQQLSQNSLAELGAKKPLTMRENLGGEYARCSHEC